MLFFFWIIYFLTLGAAAVDGLSWLASALALMALCSGRHARTRSACRQLSIYLAFLAGRGYVRCQILGIFMAVVFPFLMPRKQKRKCWSCSAGRDAGDVHDAVPKPGRGKDACELFLCVTCWNCRNCNKHSEGLCTFLNDMPLPQRLASKSPHKPLGEVVAPGLVWCTVCTKHIAVACSRCFSESEHAVRAKGVARCAHCARADLIVKGDDRSEVQTHFDGGAGFMFFLAPGADMSYLPRLLFAKAPFRVCTVQETASHSISSGSLVYAVLFSGGHRLAALSVLPSEHRRSTRCTSIHT